jgi:hypothetical protein
LARSRRTVASAAALVTKDAFANASRSMRPPAPNEVASGLATGVGAAAGVLSQPVQPSNNAAAKTEANNR